MASLAQPPQGVSTGPHLDNRRIAAALIDLVVPAAIAALAYVAGLSLTQGVLLVVIGWTLYYFFALESDKGQTLGKRVMNLRVVSADGSPASMEQIAKRTLVRVLDGHIVGLIVMLASGERRQRLGDMVAGTIVTEAETVSVPSAAEPAAAQDDPRHKRSLKMPGSLKMPAFSKPSLRKSSTGPKHKRALSMPALSLPSLRKGSPRVDRASSGADDFAAIMPPAAMPAPVQGDPVTELEPLEPSTEPQKLYEEHEPYDEHERETALAFDDEPSLELDDSPLADDGPAADDGPVGDGGPAEFDEPEYEIQFEDDPHPVGEAEPEPVGEAEPAAVPPNVRHFGDEHDEPAEDQLIIKPMETVSAIDLVMQDAEDRHPDSR